MFAALALLLAVPAQTELGTVEFDAGPARCEARFFLEETEPRVEIRLLNGTASPIWWRGPGLGCVGTHWLVPPRALNGGSGPSGMQGISCTMERNEPTTESDLEDWLIAAGASAEPCVYRPFARWNDPILDVPAMERWAWCTEFTLPRTTPPPRSMEFECPAIVLAWSRETGPRVFLDDAGKIHYPHFDPFADQPLQRGLGPFPIRFGPLQGTATLHFEEGWPVAEWTLTNPLDQDVYWSTLGVGSRLSWGFTELEFGEVEEGIDNDSWFFNTRTQRAHGQFGSPEDARFAPGETRSFRIAPLTFDPTASEDWHPDRGPQGLRRWHFVVDSTWPSRGLGTGEPRYVPTQLHMLWDAEIGFDLGLESPDRYREGREWSPFERQSSNATASFPLGDCDAILSARHTLFVFNAGAETRYWLPMRSYPAIWLREPFAEERPDVRPQEPRAWRTSGEPLAAKALANHTLNVGEMCEAWCEPTDFEEKFERSPTVVTDPEWELLLPIALPQANPPTHELDYQRGWLRVRRGAGGWLDAFVHESWPF
jgi:hypothetical protein